MALEAWVVSVLASLVFVAIGIILMVLEAKFGIGILAVGGIGCIVIAIIILFQMPLPEDTTIVYLVNVLKYTIILSGAVLAVFFGYVAYKGYQVRKLKSKLEPQSLIGKIGIAKTDIDPKGQVNLEGELWSAICKGKPYAYQGEEVEVIGFEGLTLYVRPAIYKEVDKELAKEEEKKTSKWKKITKN
ncbi:MAG: NfeD family protein [Candidatus Freyarchaeota archaeon]